MNSFCFANLSSLVKGADEGEDPELLVLSPETPFSVGLFGPMRLDLFLLCLRSVLMPLSL